MRNNNKTFRIVFLCWLIVIAYAGHAQVEWSFSAVKKVDGLVELHLKASLAEGWHIYSTDSTASPFPTRIIFQPGLLLRGVLREKGQLSGGNQKDVGFPMRYFTGTAEFIQTVRVDAAVHNVQGTVEFVICTDEQCLPPEKKKFVVELSAGLSPRKAII